jgi:hypothetical protein
MVTLGRVLLWTVVLVAPGGFLLVPVLAAHSLRSQPGGTPGLSLRARLTQLLAQVRHSLSGLQRHWTKS